VNHRESTTASFGLQEAQLELVPLRVFAEYLMSDDFLQFSVHAWMSQGEC